MAQRPKTNKTADGAKRRWTADERAKRGAVSAAPFRGAGRRTEPDSGSRAGRRDARFGSNDRRSDATDGGARQDRRPDWQPGPRNGGAGRDAAVRNERSARGDRTSDERPRASLRPSKGRDESARGSAGSERPRTFDRDRPRRDDAPRTGFRGASSRGDAPYRPDRTERPRTERPAYGASTDRPRYDRTDDRRTDDRRTDDRRPSTGSGGSGGDRPRFDGATLRGPQGGPESRPRYDRSAERPRQDRSSDERPRFDRSHDERPRASSDREERPRFDRSTQDRPRFDRLRDDRPRTHLSPSNGQDRDRPVRQDRDRDRAPRRDDWTATRDDRSQERFVAPDDVVLERLQGEVVTAAEVSGSSFADLGLGEQITRALADLGASSPFPIQAATIPDVLTAKNVLGRGRTGSGKTIAFGAGLVERLMRNWADSGRTGSGRRIGRAPRALILAPTRELALQIDRTVQPIARSVGLFTTQIVGGMPQARQVGALAKGVDIVIGTPGRIEDLIEQRRLDLSEIEITVLDEADHMADLGFLEPMQRLLRRVPSKGQRLLFSATLDAAVASLVDEFMPQPAVHEVADTDGGGTADHRVLVIEQGEKLNVLTALLASVDRTLVFARTRAFAEQLADELDGAGVKAESLHGDLNQARRTRNLARFGEGRVSALVATDVAARGIHVDSIDLVVHVDAAEDYKTYLHRSGRTGRAGASGTVVTLITARRRHRFAELLERAGIEAEFVTVRPGQDPVAALGR